MKDKILLEAKNITKIYDLDTKHPLKALDNISIKIHDGEFLCIMGPSGSGKSTLLNNISTIDFPTKGKVYIDGIEVTTMSEKEIGKFRYQNLGFIFQNYNLLDALTIYENISAPLSLQGCQPSEIRKKVLEMSQKLKIENILEKYPSECSGGQKQRAAIVRALITDPKIIIADEPTGNLDSKNSHELLMILKQLNEERSIAIIMVSHDAQIASYSSKLLLIKDGIIDKVLKRNNMTQKEYFYKIVDLNSSESQKLFVDSR